MTPLLLGVLAVLLAGPVPALLARQHRLRRTPRAALLLWQSIALAAVLSALGAGLALTTDRAWRHTPDPFAYTVAAAALLLTLLVLARLLLSGHRVGTDLRALRRRHRAHLDVVARRATGMLVLDHDLPVAYCLPGAGHARVVVSAGALGRLGDEEVAAVLAHERAHLRARHDLVLEAFSVLRRAFPRWVSSATALTEVRLLVELLADRAALRSVGRGALGRALVTLGERRATSSPPSKGAVAWGMTLDTGPDPETDLLVRVRLLADHRRHRLQAAVLVLVAAGVLVLPTAFVVAPWLLELS